MVKKWYNACIKSSYTIFGTAEWDIDIKMWIIMGFMGKWHRVQTAEASAVHNDVSASSTDEVRDGPWSGV